MNKIRPLLIGVAIFFLAAGTVYAGEKDGAKSRDRSYEKKDKSAIYKELNLTEEQQKKIEANRTEQRKQREALSKSIKEEYKKLQKALEDPSQTKEKVEPIAQKIKSLQAEMVDNRINAIFEAKAIMTPEQFAQFNQLMEKRKGEKGGHSKK
ncbi:MAG: Spy/CpxP family protein refolding chaperone [Candidatus Omnitrophica bacterium]|nr:Spy/CpxP family protein refolding chaperone [Candidatus Omnitrophota bacterium]MCG2704593.1 Spy/CpxP family protein refolding chaperone [Candidatus Omnitrophota bacterium]